jgi:hypothetical protein
MKNENAVKKILKKSVVGFPAGVLLLILAYISVYFIVGNEVFNEEMYQLHNVNTLIAQTITSGIAGYLFVASFYIISILQSKQIELEIINRHPCKAICIIILTFMCLFVFIMAILGNTKVFSKNIANLNIILLAIVFAFSGLIFCIKSSKEKSTIKKINDKIEERNQ